MQYQLRPLSATDYPPKDAWMLTFTGGPADGYGMAENYPPPRMNVVTMEGEGPMAVTYHCVHRDHEAKVADYLLDG